ncbi:MAG: EI24 domain-containing protein [Leptolyngbya sp. SIO1E4]|nr:EI24 domain-containing protein [Leptolyngbya sp. SIO1E4]
MEKLETSQRLCPSGGGPLGFFAGFSYPLRAFRMLQQHPSLRSFVVAPLIINILLGIGLYSGGLWWGLKLIDAWTLQLTEWIKPAWLDAVVQVLSPVIEGGLLLILFVVLGVVLLQFGSILGSPFYGQLSEKLEILRTGKSASLEPMGVGAIMRDLWRAILFELKKLLLLAGIGGLLLLANLIPGVGTLVATVGGLVLAVVLLCLDMFDAPLERRRLKFRQKVGIIFRCLPASASFGLICLGLVSIPLMNLLAIPLCVSAGTLFFCDRILSVSTHQPS